MSQNSRFVAVDLGAASGRVIVGTVDAARVELDEVHRFANRPVRLPTGLHWDILTLYRGVLDGLREAAAYEPASMGIDSWAVDYGLLDRDGELLGNPYHYRDTRSLAEVESVHTSLGAAKLYQLNGLQQLPINTIYQLAAARDTSIMDSACRLLLIPDLLAYWLTGEIGAERTNASTTGLFDATQRTWSAALADGVGISETLLPPLREPGSVTGSLLPHVHAETSLPEGFPVTAVASHDTASAVVAVPATTERFAYISCGTWSLVGVELDAPVLTEQSRVAGFTNELGVDDTIRYLRNVMGLWLFQECVRRWEREGRDTDPQRLLARAAQAEPFRSLVNPDDPAFLAPEDMPAAIAEYCRRTGQPLPEDDAAMVRCIMESLALAHRNTVRQAAELGGRSIDVVHVVGGGSRNELLCQLTADACGLPVIAGPAEATALGNILVQARAQGVVADRAAGRTLVANTQSLRRYEPRGDETVWRAASARVGLE